MLAFCEWTNKNKVYIFLLCFRHSTKPITRTNDARKMILAAEKSFSTKLTSGFGSCVCVWECMYFDGSENEKKATIEKFSTNKRATEKWKKAQFPSPRKFLFCYNTRNLIIVEIETNKALQTIQKSNQNIDTEWKSDESSENTQALSVRLSQHSL